MLRSETQRLPAGSRIARDTAGGAQKEGAANGEAEKGPPPLTTELNAKTQLVDANARKGRQRSAKPSPSETHRAWKTAKIVAHLMRFLAPRELLQATQVSQLWRSCGRAERRRREEALHCDCIVLQLKEDADLETQMQDTDFKTELDSNFKLFYTEPKQVIAFVAVQSVNNAAELVHQSVPSESESCVVTSDNGIVGTEAGGVTELHYGPGLEAVAVLSLPRFTDARILPFAAKSLADIKLKDFFLENIGIRGPAEQKLVRAVLLFVEVDTSDVKAANYPKHSVIRQMKGDYTSGFDNNISILGTTCLASRHENTRHELERKKSTYDASQGVKGLVFVGEAVHTKSIVIDRQFMYEAKLDAEFASLRKFLGTSTGDRFAFIFSGLICAHGNPGEEEMDRGMAGDFDGMIRNRFREEFPRIPLLGSRTGGAVFGNPHDSENGGERVSLMGADLQLGDLVLLLVVKVRTTLISNIFIIPF